MSERSAAVRRVRIADDFFILGTEGHHSASSVCKDDAFCSCVLYVLHIEEHHTQAKRGHCWEGKG